MNRWKFHRNTSRLILALASLLTLIIIVMTGVSSYAVTPDAAYIYKIKGTGLVIGDGDSHARKDAKEHQQLKVPNQVLYVPGGNKSFAYLGFIFDGVKEHADLLVSAGPFPTPSEWSFPCSAKGRFTIAWKKGSNRGCEPEGIKVQSSSKRGWLPNNNLQVSRTLLAQAEDEVTVVPTPGESTIQTVDSAAGISIDVLIGDVRVKSAKNPEGRPVKAGERYDYPQDTITPIDINPILNSPEMQDFLNPNNWLSPDISQRVADGIAGQLGEMQRAVSQLPKQPVASNPETPVSQPLTPSSPKTPVSQPLTPSSPKTPTTQSQTTLTQSPPGKGRCGEQQVSGGQAGDVRKIQLSRASGKIYIAYDMCPVPDTIIVEYESKKLLQKTVSGRGLDQVEIQGISTELTVEVIGNPNTNTTRWGYILSCPDDDKAPEPPSSVCSDSKEPSILDPLKDLIRNRLPIPLPF
jgi:hypothetical protein